MELCNINPQANLKMGVIITIHGEYWVKYLIAGSSGEVVKANLRQTTCMQFPGIHNSTGARVLIWL